MNLKDLQKWAGDDVAQDAMDDLAKENIRLAAKLRLVEADRDKYFRGEHEVQCTCTPPHKYQMRNAKCPQYVESLLAVLGRIQEMAEEDLRLSNHPLQTNLYQIEADARAALK